MHVTTRGTAVPDVHSHDRVYVTAEYLSMWAKGNYLPPLVTTSPPGTPQAQAGVLPVSATTSILYGNERVNLDQRNGGRITAGYWLVDGQFFGVEGGSGILVASVFPGSLAARFGMRAGDVIVELNGEPVANQLEFLKIFTRRSGDATWNFKLVRERKTIDLKVIPAREPAPK